MFIVYLSAKVKGKCNSSGGSPEMSLNIRKEFDQLKYRAGDGVGRFHFVDKKILFR
jgi:hypothetical protein